MKKIAALLLSTLVLSGCASVGISALPAEVDIPIAKENSRLARIGHVFITPENDGLTVRGKLYRKLSGHGPIFGHLHVDALGENEKVLASVVSGYKRPSIDSRHAKFSADLQVAQSEVSGIRVSHHETSHH